MNRGDKTAQGPGAAESGAVIACSECFRDNGLRLDARQTGAPDPDACPSCGTVGASKLTLASLAKVAHRFFVWGSLQRIPYGAAPLIQFNDQRRTEIAFGGPLDDDVRLIERILGIGLFPYGPRLWMVGEIEPLKALEDPASRVAEIRRILDSYPTVEIGPTDTFYRIRSNPKRPPERSEYDSPPDAFLGRGRFDAAGFPVLYGSPDLDVCVHECRVTAEDDLYVGTLTPVAAVRFLNLATILDEEEGTEFESLDLAVHMLFLAGSHSYGITRDLARAARDKGLDGLVYPSYFSMLRTGAMPFETVYGLATRRLPQYRRAESAKIVSNLAIFGRPVAEGRVAVSCVNRLVLRRVDYRYHFGPPHVP